MISLRARKIRLLLNKTMFKKRLIIFLSLFLISASGCYASHNPDAGTAPDTNSPKDTQSVFFTSFSDISTGVGILFSDAFSYFRSYSTQVSSGSADLPVVSIQNDAQQSAFNPCTKNKPSFHSLEQKLDINHQQDKNKIECAYTPLPDSYYQKLKKALRSNKVDILSAINREDYMDLSDTITDKIEKKPQTIEELNQTLLTIFATLKPWKEESSWPEVYWKEVMSGVYFWGDELYWKLWEEDIDRACKAVLESKNTHLLTLFTDLISVRRRHDVSKETVYAIQEEIENLLENIKEKKEDERKEEIERLEMLVDFFFNPNLENCIQDHKVVNTFLKTIFKKENRALFEEVIGIYADRNRDYNFYKYINVPYRWASDFNIQRKNFDLLSYIIDQEALDLFDWLFKNKPILSSNFFFFF